MPSAGWGWSSKAAEDHFVVAWRSASLSSASAPDSPDKSLPVRSASDLSNASNIWLMIARFSPDRDACIWIVRETSSQGGIRIKQYAYGSFEAFLLLILNSISFRGIHNIETEFFCK